MSDLELRLEAASHHVDWPQADLTMGLRSRLNARPRRTGTLAKVALVAALVGVILMVGTPWGRQAVATLFGVDGIAIRWVIPDNVAIAELDVGAEITFEEAATAVDFPILIPEDEPRSVHLGEVPAGGAIHMVWAGRPSLPAAANTGVGMLYSQFQVTDAELFLKSVDPTNEVVEVTVRGRPGFWIEGANHIILFRDAAGEIQEEGGRLSSNVLAWEENGVTHRVETSGSLEETLEFAEALASAS